MDIRLFGFIFNIPFINFISYSVASGIKLCKLIGLVSANDK